MKLRIGQGYDIHRLGRRAQAGARWRGDRLSRSASTGTATPTCCCTRSATPSSAPRAWAISGGISRRPTSAGAAPSSVDLLARIVALVHDEGYRVVNCDLTLVAEAPKLAPYRDRIIERIARVLGIEENAVGLKATTNEGLGAIGRGEGMAAFAVVLLTRRTPENGRHHAHLRFSSGARGAAAPRARGAPGLDPRRPPGRPPPRGGEALHGGRRALRERGAFRSGLARRRGAQRLRGRARAAARVAGGGEPAAARSRCRRGDPSFVVLAEDIQDPRNLGALLRVCEGAGVGRVLVRDRGSAPLSATAVKTSAGASEWLTVERIGSSAQRLEQLKKEGYWIYGLAAGGELPWSVDLTGPVVLCVGGEEDGLRQLTQERCDRLIGLPMQGHVSSLNLATAAAAVLYEAVRQRTTGKKGR